MLLPRSKVLVVDDFDTIRKVLRKTLEELGIIDVVEAGNGREALALLMAASEKKPFDFIFCDLAMPEMTGMELLLTIKNEPKLSRTPFVMVTVEAEKHVIMGALDAGVFDYITKPFSPAVLKTKLEKLMDPTFQRKAA